MAKHVAYNKIAKALNWITDDPDLTVEDLGELAAHSVVSRWLDLDTGEFPFYECLETFQQEFNRIIDVERKKMLAWGICYVERGQKEEEVTA